MNAAPGTFTGGSKLFGSIRKSLLAHAARNSFTARGPSSDVTPSTMVGSLTLSEAVLPDESRPEIWSLFCASIELR